ncbi:5'-3'-deoxyribonucleotidase [Candidatus Woesearchaeota archaeon]|nr:5'-3'-deoxyribonucleotidase [Candidatus Woesearchaeota archaeon]
MIYLVDCDGVIADFEKGVLAEFRKRHPDKPFIPLEERTTLFLEDQYSEELRPLLKDIFVSQGLFRHLELIEGSLKALKELRKYGDVFICTAPMPISAYYHKERYEWIEENLGREWADKRTIVSRDKAIISGNFLIDDKPQQGVIEPEWEQLLFDQPYNQSVTGLRRITWKNYREVLGLK